jgi:cytochrome c553
MNSNQPADSALPHSVRALRLFAGVLACLISLHGYGAPATLPAPDNIETRMLACTSCHGLHGQGTENDYFPRLAGKPAGYLFNQLVAFRSARRNYSPMNYLLEYQTDGYLQAMAGYFASQNPPYLADHATATSSALLARGQELATQGDASRNIQACAACHNPNFTGVDPGIPALLGLRSRYISAQLGAWRYGTRTAIAPDCMQIVAANLSEDDVTALAAWLSRVPAPLKALPLPKGSLTTPLPCGSEPQ